MSVLLRAATRRKQVHRWSAQVKVQAAAGEAGRPSFSIEAYNGGLLFVAGFDLPVVIDLAGLILPDAVPLLAEHREDIDSVLGQGTPSKTDTALTFAGQIVASTPVAKHIVDMALAGYEWQASVGCEVLRQERVGTGQSVTVNGQTFEGPLIVSRESALFEVSIVPRGADPTTAVRIAAHAARLKGSIMGFEAWVKSLGLDVATLSEEAKQALMSQYNTLHPAGAGEGDPAVSAEGETDPDKKPDGVQAEGATEDDKKPDAVQAALAHRRKLEATELRRVAAIQAKAAGHPLIAAKAIEAGWSVDKTELEVMKASRPKAPAGHVTENETGPQVLQAAVCLQGKMGNVEKAFDNKTLEAADRFRRGGMGLHRLLLEAAWANGYDGRFVTRSTAREVLEHAFPSRRLQAGFTTLSLPGIFSNTANKFLLDGYNHVEDVWRRIAHIDSASDFKTVTRYRLVDGGVFEEVGPTGELKHGQFAEEAYTNRAKTYGRLYTITREDIINDDLGALTTIPKRIGRQAALKLNLVFWTAFLDNAAFFTTERGNYIEGAGTVLGSAGLSQGVAALRKLKDPGGHPVNVKPKFLLTGPTLEPIADELYVSRQLVMGGSTKQPSDNVHFNKYEPLQSAYLEDTTLPGYSAEGWYLLGDPADVPVIEVMFLDGVETPTIEDADANFDTLGVQMRGFFDFGIEKQDYRGAIKSKGKA